MTALDNARVVVVGGGHNGLVAAALLAKRGARVTVCERRDVVGGAAITEQPWGPGWKVSALSYVLTAIPREIVEELDLATNGYRVHPQHGYFVPYRDGTYLQLPDGDASSGGRRRAEIARISDKDADAIGRWDGWLGALAGALAPLLLATPPRVGSRRPADLLDQAQLAWRLRGLGEQGVADVTRLFTMSIADLLDEFFESPRVKAVLAVSGIIGTWAGPRSAGTAYVMAHHRIGETGDGELHAWGFPEGGMGAVSDTLRHAAERYGATIRTDAAVSRIDVRSGRVRAVVLENGDELAADVVVATTHPQITFLEQVERRVLPDDFVARMEHWRSRSGVVKINLALDRLPEFAAKPGFDPELHGGTIVLADDIDEMEGAFQDAVRGDAAHIPFADICIPSVFDPTLAPDGKHVMSVFTQWVPAAWHAATDRDALHAYVERVLDRLELVAPGLRSSVLHQQVIGPYEMEHTYGLRGGNIFHGELSPDQLFHLRPAPGYADARSPIAGLYQASSATHGGGGVTGIPGLNAVHAIDADLRTNRWSRR
jgi:phytoene dehydrogenase-like protein